MIRVLLNGARGRMGIETARLVAARPGFEFAGGVDAAGDGLTRLRDFSGEADVLIDFSHHAAAGEVAEFLMLRRMGGVICTTGHTAEEGQYLDAAAALVPVFRTANTSLGIAFLARAVRAAAALFPAAEVSIVECHHTRKLDAPSGTALVLARAAEEGRRGHTSPPVDIHSLRMGNVAGDHQVIVNTGTETITLRHEVHDRALFAEGALAAAEFLAGKGPGTYGMEDLLKKEGFGL
ncbi:MAG: 4-hydroxy-tetrahydrodipicolinate reductase [Clostridia bacterium]|nr:4-hydroxy-tetrahydrodipicolinate reductase [Clostridia bacterium]